MLVLCTLQAAPLPETANTVERSGIPRALISVHRSLRMGSLWSGLAAYQPSVGGQAFMLQQGLGG